MYSQSVSTQAVRIPSPLQLGVSVALGCETIVHCVDAIMCDDSFPSRCKWTLQVDFSNTFNFIDSEFVFQEVRSHVPSLAA